VTRQQWLIKEDPLVNHIGCEYRLYTVTSGVTFTATGLITTMRYLSSISLAPMLELWTVVFGISVLDD